MEGGTNNAQQMVTQVSEFNGKKKADDFLKWSSKLRVNLSLYNQSIFIVQESQRQNWTTIRQSIAKLRMMQITICTVLFTSLHLAQLLCRAEV